jgi:hypothetical protein
MKGVFTCPDRSANPAPPRPACVPAMPTAGTLADWVGLLAC